MAETKKCTECKVTKDVNLFGTYKNKSGKRLPRSPCKSCRSISSKEYCLKNLEKVANWHADNYKRTKKEKALYKQEHHLKNPGIRRNRSLLTGYGITLEQYNNLLTDQDNVCAICRLPETAKLRGKIKNLAVDHDHKTGEVRALLCAKCNTGIGNLKDNPGLLRAAADYIESHQD